jgi:hypothetical protein
MKVGDVVRWTSDDGRGEKTLLGEITLITDKRIKFKTIEGELDVLKTDGKFEPTDEKIDFPATAPPAPKKRSKKKTNQPTAGSKTEAAIKIYRSMQGSTRGEIIKALIDKANLTPAGAATYYTNCKKVVDNE